MMKKPMEKLMKEEETSFKPHLVVDNTKTAGKQPPKDGEPWLDHLDVGTNFLCRDKSGASFVLPQFVLMEKVEPDGKDEGMGSWLLSFLPGENKPLPVDNRLFCKRFSYHSTVGVHKPDEHLDETKDDVEQ